MWWLSHQFQTTRQASELPLSCSCADQSQLCQVLWRHLKSLFMQQMSVTSRTNTKCIWYNLNVTCNCSVYQAIMYRHTTYCVEVQGGHFEHFLYLEEAVTQKLCFGRPIFLIVIFRRIISQIHVLLFWPCIFRSSYTAYIVWPIESLLYVHASLCTHRIHIICTDCADTSPFPSTLTKTASCTTVSMTLPIVSLYVPVVQLVVTPVYIGLNYTL